MMAFFDPRTDLRLERHIALPPEAIWAAWTRPELLTEWFLPRPWKLTACELDLRPGGAFQMTMCAPDGRLIPTTCCMLEVVAPRRLVWTNTLRGDYRPTVAFAHPNTCVLEFAGDTDTRYTMTVLHSDATVRDRHEPDFHERWNKMLEQLTATMQVIR